MSAALEQVVPQPVPTNAELMQQISDTVSDFLDAKNNRHASETQLEAYGGLLSFFESYAERLLDDYPSHSIRTHLGRMPEHARQEVRANINELYNRINNLLAPYEHDKFELNNGLSCVASDVAENIRSKVKMVAQDPEVKAALDRMNHLARTPGGRSLGGAA